MSEIVAPQGSPLAVALLSVEQLEHSIAFYRDEIGLDAGPVSDWRGAAFEALWQLPAGTSARCCLLGVPGGRVGRVLLVEFVAASVHALTRELIQPTPNSQVFGLANLNFYVRDAASAVRDLTARGYVFWSRPTQHSLDEKVGNPIEVIFDGPDGVAINLVELSSRDSSTRIGQMRAYVESHGYTRAGYTPVVTTSHVARSIAAARRFYEDVLQMGVLIDDELTTPHVNAFLRLPADGRTHITFMQGNHMFGKIALSEPLNYVDRCLDLRPRAHAPNIGYLAQIFEVADLDRAAAACAGPGVEAVAARSRIEVPGLGLRDQWMVRNPGSGALQWLIAE